MTPYRMPQMFELESTGIQFVRSWLKPPETPGLLAFWHAVEFRTTALFGEQRPSAFFLGDHRLKPRSVVYFRPSQPGAPSHVFGAGESRVAVRWLATRPVLTFLLHAPPHWHEALEALVGNVQRVSVETWSTRRTPAGGVPGFVRRLSRADSHAFHNAVPWWGLRGWGSFANLLEHGAAFGV